MISSPKVLIVRKSSLQRRLDSVFYYYQRLEEKKPGDESLDKMATIVRDTLDPQKFPERSFGYVDLADVDETIGEIIEPDMRKGSDISGLKNRFSVSDILFARIEPSVYNKKTAFVRRSASDSVCSTEFYVLRARERVDPEFLFWMLRSGRTVAQVRGKLIGTTGRRRLDRFSLMSILLPNPPLPVQHEIAEIMRQAHEQQLSKYSEASRIMEEAGKFLERSLEVSLPSIPLKMTYKVSRSDLKTRFDSYFYQPRYVETLKTIESGKHGTKSLREVSDFSHVTVDPSKNPMDPFKYVEISGVDVRFGEIVESQDLLGSKAPSRARMLIGTGDILVSTTRPYRGAIAIVPEWLDGSVCSTGFAVLRPKINSRYLWAVLRSRIGLLQMERGMSGGNYPAIVPGELESIRIPVPPDDTQERIASQVADKTEQARSIVDEGKEMMERAYMKVDVILRKHQTSAYPSPGT